MGIAVREVDDPRFFLSIVRAGSLALAARTLDVTPSAVTQRLQALEARLGVRLLDRGSRKLRLTDEGEVFAVESEDLVARYDRLLDAVQSRKSVVRGHLRVLGTLGFGRRHVAPTIGAFHAEYPQVKISLTLSDRWVGNDDAPYDVVIHIGALEDSSQVAFRIAPNARFAVASPLYCKRRGVPKSPDELAQHECLVLRENDDDVSLWRFIGARGKPQSVRVRPSLSSNDGEAIKTWAMAGLGIMIRSEWDVADEIKSGKLIRVLESWKLPEANVVALVPERRGMSARARAFVEFLAKRFQPKPDWRT